MRKAIPVSLVLVALSLIGFVILQVNWVINTQLLQSQRIRFRVDQAAREAADSLHKYTSFNNNFIYQNQGFGNGNFGITEPYIKISQVLSQNEIKRIVHRTLVQNGIDDLKPAYAVTYMMTGNNGVIESSSPDFMETAHRINIDSAYAINAYAGISPINLLHNSDDGSISIQETITVIVTDITARAWRSLIWVLAGSALLTLITIAAFYLTVRTMLEQRKLSKIKSDFINNMTHEFKTPLATISLAVDALHNPRVQGNQEKTQYFSGIIKEENKRMNKHVETILQAAFMEKQELQLNKNEIHVHEIIRQLVANFSLQLMDKNGEAVTHLNASNDLIAGDEVHITNLINNLIDNAVKYSKPDVPPRIVVTTTNSAKNLVIQIKDNGIGMSKESVKRIFEKFYRAHTGNIHNVKGFGLGMSYVKDIVDAHKGKIKVDSVLGKGSTFILELPLA